jgi:hypothetical protein
MYDEYGVKVKKRALAFFVDRLSEFLEYDVAQICHATATGLEEAEEGYA